MKTYLLKTSIFIFLLSTFGLFGLSTFAMAQSSGLSAIPPRLGGDANESLILNPGQNVARTIKVRNESDQEKLITIEVHDIIVNDDFGTPVILDDSQSKNNRWSAASWIQVSPSQYKLKPGETKSLQVMFLVPEDALPGGHYAGIFHTFKDQTVTNNNGSVSGINSKVGTLVYITIPGPVKEDARVTTFSAPQFSEYGPIDFKTTVINFSDIHITPAGAIKITNWLGGKTADLALPATNIFPGTSRNYQLQLPNKWLFGRYQAELVSSYGTTGQVLIATLFFWVIPWRLLILLGIIIILILLIIYLNKKKNELKSSSTTQDPELTSLKQKYKD